MSKEVTKKAIIKEALRLIRQRFENKNEVDCCLDFHRRSHTLAVINRASRLGTSMLKGHHLYPSELDLLIFFAAGHDLIQDWIPMTHPDGRVTRQRQTPENERRSAVETVGLIERFCPELLKEYYLVQLRRANLLDVALDAILATVPSWDHELMTVIQPNLTPTSNLISHILALADLGAAGMDGRAFLVDGDAVFREENLDIKRTLSETRQISDIPVELQDRYRERMLAWDRTQASFALGRKRHTAIQLKQAELPLTVCRLLASQFTTFDDAISACRARHTLRKSMNFEQLARDMGYFG